MTISKREEGAAAFVLGTLDAAERARVEASVEHDKELAMLVEAWEQRLAPLALGLDPVPPPDGLFAQIEAAIDAPEPAGARGTRTVRAGEGVWQAIALGVERKLLTTDARSGRQTLLIRMRPGAHYAPHDHPQDEECMVLEGGLRFGDLELRAGDYHLAPAGVPHPAAFSPSGCLLFISTAG